MGASRLALLGAHVLLCLASPALAWTVRGDLPEDGRPIDLGLEASVEVDTRQQFVGWRQFQVIEPESGMPLESVSIDASRLVTCRSTRECPVAVTSVHRHDVPAAVTVVIDHSGSMRGQPSALARDLVVAILARLKGQDRLRVVGFSARSTGTRLLTASEWRRSMLVRRLKWLESHPKQRPPCLTEYREDQALEDWANQCGVNALHGLVAIQLGAHLASEFPPRGMDVPDGALASAVVELMKSEGGFIPACDAVPGIVVVSDFRNQPAASAVQAHAAELRSAFLVRTWAITTQATPGGIGDWDETLRLSAGDADAVAARVVDSLRGVHVVGYEGRCRELLDRGCISIEHVSDGVRYQVRQPDAVVPPRSVLEAAVASATEQAALRGATPSVTGVLRQVVRSLREAALIQPSPPRPIAAKSRGT